MREIIAYLQPMQTPQVVTCDDAAVGTQGAQAIDPRIDLQACGKAQAAERPLRVRVKSRALLLERNAFYFGFTERHAYRNS
jgi:hypothetical protein